MDQRVPQADSRCRVIHEKKKTNIRTGILNRQMRELFQQFRAIGVNYNQAVKELHIHFTEKKALALLYKLEKLTLELVELNRRIVELSQKLASHGSQDQRG